MTNNFESNYTTMFLSIDTVQKNCFFFFPQLSDEREPGLDPEFLEASRIYSGFSSSQKLIFSMLFQPAFKECATGYLPPLFPAKLAFRDKKTYSFRIIQDTFLEALGLELNEENLRNVAS